MYNNSQNDLSSLQLQKDIQQLLDSGTLDISQIHEIAEMVDRQKYLAMHPYSISLLKDGRWQTHFKDPEKGRIEKRLKSKKALEDYIVQYYKNQCENPTIEQCFEAWNNNRLELKKISNATHMRYNQVFSKHYKEIADMQIKELSADILQTFLEEQICFHNLTAKDFSNLKTITRGFLKYAKRKKLIFFPVEETLADLDVSSSVFKKNIKEDYKEIFNENEYPLIIDYLIKNMDMHNLGILLMLVTGIRVGELVCLKYEDFNSQSTFQVKRTETKYKDPSGKWHREVKESPKTDAGRRIVIIPDKYNWILAALRRINPFGEYIFEKNGKRMSTDAIRKRQYRICKWIHIPPKSPHKCRKTYSSILLDNHVDNNLIIGQVGHTNISCTENFYHKDRKAIDTKKEILNNLPEFKII